MPEIPPGDSGGDPNSLPPPPQEDEGGLPDKLDALGQELQAIAGSDAPDDVKQAAGDLMQAMQAFVEVAQGGGGGQPGGATTPEQGGAQGAVPAGPGNMPQRGQ